MAILESDDFDDNLLHQNASDSEEVFIIRQKPEEQTAWK